MRFGSRVRASFFFSQIRHRNALTEIAWEDDVQGPGMAMSTVASEKNRELMFTGNVFYKQWHLCVFREHDLLKISNINPRQEARFSLWKKLVHRESGRNGALPKITQPRHFWTLFKINHTNYGTIKSTALLCMTPMKRLVANTVYCNKKSIVAPPQFEIFTWFLTFLLIQTEADISF